MKSCFGPTRGRQHDGASSPSCRRPDGLRHPFGGTPGYRAPFPRFSATLPRGTREPVSFHVHSGGRTNPTAGTEAIVQFLDRLVVSTVPPQPIRVILAGRPRGQIDSPVVLVGLGDGAVELDGGALRSRLDGNLDGTAQSPSSDRPSGSVLYAPGPSEAFVEALRCQIVARISRAFPTLPRLRPVNAASLLQSPSLFQTLAALGSGWLPRVRRAPCAVRFRSARTKVPNCATFARS
ncbi:MAG: hypothetical protein HZT43_02170 [Exiguobacterium profundum]|nr:MAG: hypothetical protein HZT43_02170 [Exiguobacterium profundum]